MARYKIEESVHYRGQEPRTYTVGEYDTKRDAQTALKRCYQTPSRSYSLVKL